MIWLLIVMMLGAGVGMPGAEAQTKRAKAPAATRWPIESLTVEGNHNYTKDQILAVTGLKLKQLAGKDEFEAARDRLVATGVFETVGYKFAPASGKNGYAASFQVIEVAQTYPLRFDRLGVPDKDLTAWLREKDPLFAPRLAATKQVLERYTKWVQEYVTAHGSKDTVVAKMTPLEADQFVILFRPVRPEPAVAEVSFEGNQVVPTSALRKAIAEVAVGSPYNEERFHQYLDAAVRALYDARGRVRVKFTNIAVSNAKDVEGLAIKVTLDEGDSYDLGNVSLEGAPDFDSGVLLKAGKFKPGDLANFDDIGQGVDRVKKKLAHEGFLRNQIDIVRHIDDGKKTVDVVLRVTEGPQYMQGALKINGLDLDGESAVRKFWTLKEGKPFDPEYPNYFLKRVREEGMFDNLGETTADTTMNDKAHTVDVTLNFKYGAPVKRKEQQRPF
jgi:outer membrane protein insertion porin family